MHLTMDATTDRNGEPLAMRNSAEPFSDPEEPQVQAHEPNSEKPSTSDSIKPHSKTSIRTYLLTSVHLPLAYIPLLICSFLVGLLDSSAFNAFNTFVSMQTGNTIFLALGASYQPTTPPYLWARAGVAILCYLLGAFFFGRFMRLFGKAGLTRIALCLGFAVQALGIMVAAGVVTGGVVPQPEGTNSPQELAGPHAPLFIVLLPIAFLSFQAAGQAVASRVLGFGEIPTVVLTSAYTDLTSDANLFKWKNAKRDRRFWSAVCLLVGGFCGGWISRSEGKLETVLWVAAVIKLGIGISWLFWTGAAVEEKA